MICPYCLSKKYINSYKPSTIFNKKKFDYLKCLDCELIYVYPFPNENDYAAMYPPTYQGEFNKINNSQYDDLFILIKSYTSDDTKKLLDYGCGNGDLLYQAKNLGFNVSGVEYNSENINVLKKNIPSTPFYEINEFNDIDEKFDIIILNNVLEHVINPNELIQSLKLKSNGILVVLGPMEENFSIAQIIRKIYFLFKKIFTQTTASHPPYHITFTNHNNQLEIFQKNNFEKLTFITKETAWPFPNNVNFTSIGSFFKSVIALISIKSSKLFSNKAGNIFIYIGKKK